MNENVSKNLRENEKEIKIAISNNDEIEVLEERVVKMIDLEELKQKILKIESVNPVGEEAQEDFETEEFELDDIELDDIEDYFELEEFLKEIGNNLINEVIDILMQDFAIKNEELKIDCWSTWCYLNKRKEFYEDKFKDALKEQIFITFIKRIYDDVVKG